MPGMGGLEALRQIRPIAPQTLIIMLTAYGTVENAVEAMRLGAYDFLIKSVDLSSVDPVVDRALEFLALRQRVEFSLEDQNSPYALSNIDARSPTMQLLLGQVRDVAQNAKSTVLLQGETGHWERIPGASHPLQQPTCDRPICRRQLHRDSEGAVRKRAVRVRARRLYRRPPAQTWIA